MKTARFECPQCQQPFETDEDTARKGVRCPGCGVGFVPDKYKPEPKIIFPPQPASIVTPKESVKRQAQRIEGFSFLLVWLGLVALVIGIFVAFNNGQIPYIFWIGLGAIFSLALWLYIAAQIVHIRANTEK